MDAIRTKDKLFLLVVAPLALAAAYVFLWRGDAVRRVDACRGELAELVSAEDFPDARAQAERRLAQALEELSAEKKVAMPAAQVTAEVGDSVAARERAVRSVFRQAGLVVTRSAHAEPKAPAAGDALRRTGVRPDPVCRLYVIDGGYAPLCTALRTFGIRKMAVIPDRVEMARPGHWTVALWL